MLEPEQVLPPIIIDELVPRRMQHTFRPLGSRPFTASPPGLKYTIYDVNTAISLKIAAWASTGIESILINGLPAHTSSNHVASNNFFSYHVCYIHATSLALTSTIWYFR
ncbi:hypothetical protein DFH07DRAFT_778598 [Mycena maculata]|uniref:Uncharacterized protein n=1 Tax=Mycena maculata TaxID=230809 RepID=A0AAD7IDR5_9AGAR|nr:hypothetical protein DFH07DRAFT_778598 [Mycena maculata]